MCQLGEITLLTQFSYKEPLINRIININNSKTRETEHNNRKYKIVNTKGNNVYQEKYIELKINM